MNYADAGVSLARADEAMVGVKKSVRTTFNQGVLGDVGNFGGLFTLNHLGMKDPVLVSSVDGVGTKLKVDIEMGTHELPGQDIVNHCCDDILVQGARPLFFLDYVATGRLEPGVMDKLVAGMAKACRENDLVLIGGETAEMPGFYGPGDYDISGTIVGVVERENIIDGKKIKPGTIILGLPSTGLHTNGYSLARKVLFDVAGYKVDTLVDGMDKTGNVSCVAGNEWVGGDGIQPNFKNAGGGLFVWHPGDEAAVSVCRTRADPAWRRGIQPHQPFCEGTPGWPPARSFRVLPVR